MTNDEAFHIGEEIARGGPCISCGRFWNELEPHTLLHKPDCEYNRYMQSLPILAFEPIWGLNYPDDFNLEPASMESACDLEPAILTNEILKCDDESRTTDHLDHALMLFAKLSRDSAFDGLPPDTVWAACCDTVLIWSKG